ncbi:MAG TPA: hypothetical protein VHG51_04375 [Longimicrobiaceae bacterium]|nr:hypothetical protein [Longimicrobiaceae bacterium]
MSDLALLRRPDSPTTVPGTGMDASTRAPFWWPSPLLAGVGFSMLVLGAVFLAGVLLDPREIMGAPRWMKPAKFAVSTGIYSLTFVWLLSHLRGRPTLVRRAARITAWVFLVEVALIALQAARGTTSHFNQTTTLNGWITLTTGVAILVLWGASIVVGVALLRQHFQDPAFGWSLRLGLWITVLGAAVGIYMATPTASQMEVLRTGERPAYIGAHSVGGEDGGAGVPVANWSTAHGDLRVSHFVGLHALQVLPLLGWLLGRSRRLRERQRVRLVGTAGASYAALTGVLFWQALRGQPLLHPDALTWSVLAAWLALSTAAGGLALRAGPPAYRLPLDGGS